MDQYTLINTHLPIEHTAYVLIHQCTFPVQSDTSYTVHFCFVHAQHLKKESYREGDSFIQCR